MNGQTRVLIVDDEPDVIRGSKIWLAAAGYTTSSVADGDQVLQAVIHEPPDVIVMDVRMPHMDGLAALAELKADDETSSIPVVMLSASLVDQEKALDAGATFFLTKPYEGRKLVAAVASAIMRCNTKQKTDQFAHCGCGF